MRRDGRRCLLHSRTSPVFASKTHTTAFRPDSSPVVGRTASLMSVRPRRLCQVVGVSWRVSMVMVLVVVSPRLRLVSVMRM